MRSLMTSDPCAPLLASARLTPGARLWTRDRRRPHEAARTLDLAAVLDH